MARETLTREQIVTATMEMLDSEGIEALSMRKLGERLGSAATSMYWHVGSKQNLVALCSDQAWREIELPDIEALGWRDAAEALARRTFDMLVRHHWIVSATSAYFAYGTGMARYQDHSYAVLEAAGFEDAELDWASSTLFHYVLGAAAGETGAIEMRRRLSRVGDGETQLVELQRSSAEIAGSFPRLKARMDALGDVDRGSAVAESFTYGILTVLDGLDARLTRA